MDLALFVHVAKTSGKNRIKVFFFFFKRVKSPGQKDMRRKDDGKSRYLCETVHGNA